MLVALVTTGDSIESERSIFLVILVKYKQSENSLKNKTIKINHFK